MTSKAKAIFYPQPRYEKDYAFRTVTEARPTETAEQVTALMERAADNCDFVRGAIEDHKRGNIELDREGFDHLNFFLVGCGAAMRRAAEEIAERGQDEA